MFALHGFFFLKGKIGRENRGKNTRSGDSVLVSIPVFEFAFVLALDLMCSKFPLNLSTCIV